MLYDELIDNSKISNEYRPFVRWWWFGSGITREEIKRELEEMSAKGIGGVEIQPIYAAQKSKKNDLEKKIVWLSDEWLNLVAFTVETGHSLGMDIDMTFCSGWPFGGPYINAENASAKLKLSKKSVRGGRLVKIPIKRFQTNVKMLSGLIAIQKKTNLDIENSINLIDFVKDDQLIWNAPEGKWIVYAFCAALTKQKVKRAAPGAEGLVMDHLNNNAFKVHADALGGALKKKLGNDLSGVFRSFFCDSWEVFGENWTKDFLRKFKTAKGYDIEKYLPFFSVDPKKTEIKLRKIRSNIDRSELYRVIYDYLDFHSQLILKEFFKTFSDYCHQSGVKSRVQPYSAPTDLLKAYSLFDFLEIEGFGRYGISTLYYGSVDPRLASSAAHIYGKKNVSCESFTWLDEHFSVSLERIKREADQIILHGVNQIIYHGYPYSPKEAGNPGWVFYASILANHNNTWWPYFGELNNYIAKNAYLSKNSVNVADFCVYLPIHDVWSNKPNHLKDLRVALKENGHFTDFDYVNDDCLQNYAQIQNEMIEIGNGKYEALILWNTDFVPYETAIKIRDLVADGMKLILVGGYPTSSPGHLSYLNGNSEKVNAIFQDFKSQKNSNVHFINYFSELHDLMKKLNVIPDFKCEYLQEDDISKNIDKKLENQPPIKYLHQYRVNENNSSERIDLYFIVNESDKNQKVKIDIRATGNTQLWDISEEKKYTISNNRNNETTSLILEFSKYQSYWLIVTSESIPIDENLAEYRPYSEISYNEISLNKDWDVIFDVPANSYPQESAKSITKTFKTLESWNSDPDVRYFSGTAVYSKTFELSQIQFDSMKNSHLDLGNVYDIAEVIVNGENLGVSYTGERIKDLKDSLNPGRNSIEIKVTNLLLNKIIGYSKLKTPWKPEYYFVNLKYRPFNAKNMKLLPSGLIGPVKIKFE